MIAFNKYETTGRNNEISYEYDIYLPALRNSNVIDRGPKSWGAIIMRIIYLT